MGTPVTLPVLDISTWDDHVPPSMIIADGWNVTLAVRDGCLIVKDGTPSDKRVRNITRLEASYIRQIINLGQSGYTTLEAKRWMTDNHISYTELADDTPAGDWKAISGQITNPLPALRYLISHKIDTQLDWIAEHVPHLNDLSKRARIKAQGIYQADRKLIIDMEKYAAYWYWRAWKETVRLPWKDPGKVPEHWRAFPGRTVLRKGGCIIGTRGATDPVNAMINYAYRVGETQTRRACLTHGMHPGIGISHPSRETRESFLYDLMEPLRPWCTAAVYDLIQDVPWFDRYWCHEIAEGKVRIDAPLTHRIAGWAPDMFKIIEAVAKQTACLLREGQ